MSILPLKFETLLKENQKLEAVVKNVLSEFGEIIDENQLYFFEEYTDHGSKHIQQVLNASEDIVTEESIKNILRAEDVTILILAIILHDLGMHTSFATFTSMLEGAYDDIRIKELDSKIWKELWNEYLDEAKKFSGKQRSRIFGNEEHVITEPDLEKKDNLNGSDKKLIGEFIRRHHARIAHEIALKGLIGKNGNLIPFAIDLDERRRDYRDLAGLVARSHGLAIRDCFDYLEKFSKDEWAQPYSINITFLMVIIRIADYFQFTSDRTSSNTIKLKTFSSPISELEFVKHESVKFVKPFKLDNETLYVEAAPPSSFVFLKLKDLFNDVQQELDLGWAVLGEIYGKEAINKKPQLKYRRIKSNIDDRRYFSKLPFVAEKIFFNTDEDLPKLLIAPLYGNDPTYGVRELLQNSIDACRERDLEEKRQDNNYQSLIAVSVYRDLTTNKYYFEIKDNGRGMSLFELKNYFLKAGASFRKSNEWRKTFENEVGDSIVLRTGRFGIGVLAAFLIGNEISVKTKGIHEDVGYEFTTQIDTNQIEIIKSLEISNGTIIRILIEKNAYLGLSEIRNFNKDDLYSKPNENNKTINWTKWFTLNNPEVVFNSDIVKNFKPFSNADPSYNDEKSLDWNSLQVSNFNLIRWTYSSKYSKVPLTCNGIIIPNGYQWSQKENFGLSIETPLVSIFDYNAALNLNLNRNSIVGNRLPFEKELVTEIYNDIIAFVLCTSPDTTFKDGNLNISRDHITHPAVYRHLKYEEGIFDSDLKRLYLRNGFILNADYFLSKCKCNKIHTLNLSKAIIEGVLTLPSAFQLISLKFISNYTQHDLNKIIDPIPFGRVSIKTALYDKLFDPKKNRVRFLLKKEHIVEERNKDWITYSYRYSANRLDYNFSEFENIELLQVIKERKVNSQYEKNLFNSLLELYFKDDVIIPYDLEERKRKYNFAFQKLDKYIKKYLYL